MIFVFNMHLGRKYYTEQSPWVAQQSNLSCAMYLSTFVISSVPAGGKAALGASF